MKAATLKQMESEAGHPPGIAARIESTDLRLLLDERARIIAALKMLRLEIFHYRTTSRGVHYLNAAIIRADEVIQLAEED